MVVEQARAGSSDKNGFMVPKKIFEATFVQQMQMNWISDELSELSWSNASTQPNWFSSKKYQRESPGAEELFEPRMPKACDVNIRCDSTFASMLENF